MNRRGFFASLFSAAAAAPSLASEQPDGTMVGEWRLGYQQPTIEGEAAMRADRIAELRRLAAGDFTGHEYRSHAPHDVDAWRSVSAAGRWLILCRRNERAHYAALRSKALKALAEYDRTGLAHYLFGD